MPTLGNGEAQALIQGLKGALLREMVGYAGQTAGTLEQVADGNGLVNYLLDMNGTVTGTQFKGTGTQTFSGALVGQTRNIISTNTAGAGPTALTAAQADSLVLFDRAAGGIWTLPTPVVGMEFDFYVATTVTSNSYKVITNAGSVFLCGSLFNIDTDTSNAVAAWTGNGTTHVAVTMAAAGTNATGGIQGTWLRFTCLTATLWSVQGHVQGAGTVATPFATS